jgi:hypothetical protein
LVGALGQPEGLVQRRLAAVSPPYLDQTDNLKRDDPRHGGGGGMARHGTGLGQGRFPLAASQALQRLGGPQVEFHRDEVVLGGIGDPLVQVVVGCSHLVTEDRLPAEVGQRARDVVLVAVPAGEIETTLQERVAALVLDSQFRGAGVVEGVDEDLGFAEPLRQRDRLLAPGNRFVRVPGEHAELGLVAVGPG